MAACSAVSSCRDMGGGHTMRGTGSHAGALGLSLEVGTVDADFWTVFVLVCAEMRGDLR